MPIVADALKVVEELRGKPNVFALGESEITPKGARSSCSSFLCWLLGIPFRRAVTFAEHIKAGVMPRTTDVRKVKPGMVGAIRYSQERDGMSGHCFLVVTAPISSGINGEWHMAIVDSCRTHHGSGDTRVKNPGGIGRGYLVLLTDERNTIQGYRWSTSMISPRVKNSEMEEILIGSQP